MIAGPDEQGTRAALERQARALGLMDSISFKGPVYGEEKACLLHEADLFVLPSRSENFGLVVAEALAAGVPVIATRATPWAELLGSSGSSKVREFGSSKVDPEVLAETVDSCDQSCESCDPVQKTPEFSHARTLELSHSRTSRCGWWVEVGVAPLAEALREAMSLTDEERCMMGENGRRLVEKKYRWEVVAEQMIACYRSLGADD